MNDLHDWLIEIDATMTGLIVEEIECGDNCRCDFCEGPAEIRHADEEPSNGFAGYSLARALTINITIDGFKEKLTGSPLTTCTWCHAIARRELKEHRENDMVQP